MFSFNKSFAALVGLSLLVVAFAALLPPAGAAPADKGPRKFYLTKTGHTGSQALSACASGYHMASLWEILDPSNLKYDTELGLTRADSGFGPTFSDGWIRTGFTASGTLQAGLGNCQTWTSANGSDGGTTVALPVNWDSTNVTPVSPWNPGAFPCSLPLNVWCVQD
jgi:hypothetical protein